MEIDAQQQYIWHLNTQLEGESEVTKKLSKERHMTTFYLNVTPLLRNVSPGKKSARVLNSPSLLVVGISAGFMRHCPGCIAEYVTNQELLTWEAVGVHMSPTRIPTVFQRPFTDPLSAVGDVERD